MTLQDHPRSMIYISFESQNMRFPISDQWQHRPYLAPFSHNTSVTNDGQTDGRTDGHGRQPWRRHTTAQSLLKCGWLKMKKNVENKNCRERSEGYITGEPTFSFKRQRSMLGLSVQCCSRPADGRILVLCRQWADVFS